MNGYKNYIPVRVIFPAMPGGGDSCRSKGSGWPNVTGFRDPTGLWGLPDHESMTLAAIDSNLKGLGATQRCEDYIKGTVKGANWGMDIGGPMEYHYTREPNSDIKAADDKYAEWIASKYKAAKDALDKDPPDCDGALIHLGGVSHSWQDLYGHAIGGTFAGEPGHWKVWSAGSNPDPENRSGIRPCTYPGEHPSGGQEPNFDNDADERAARFNGATNYTTKRFDFLKTWWEKCGCWCNSK